jgi:uncharacterized membrane protein
MEPHQGTREEMRRAIRRLNALEYVILLAAVLLALVGGALAAFLIRSLAGFPFGITWAVASVLLFVLPGVAVYGRELRKRTELTDGNREPRAGESDGG